MSDRMISRIFTVAVPIIFLALIIWVFVARMDLVCFADTLCVRRSFIPWL